MRLQHRVLVTSFMRMQPPTRGHDLIVEKVARWDYISEIPTDRRIYLSRSENSSRNPLPYVYKLNLARKLYGEYLIASTEFVRNPLDILIRHNDTYTDIVFICGQDRLSEYRTVFNKYNGHDYDYESITVMSAGQRDPDGRGVECISGTRIRDAALRGDRAKFEAGISDYFTGDNIYLADQLWECLVESTRRLHGWSSDTPTTSHTSDSNAQTSSEAETGQATS